MKEIVGSLKKMNVKIKKLNWIQVFSNFFHLKYYLF